MCNNDNKTSNDNAAKRSIFPATVIANEDICSEHFRLLLDVGEKFPPTFAGQFVQVQAGGDDSATEPVVHEWGDDEKAPKLTRSELSEQTALLRRPISLGGRFEKDGRVILELIHRVIGRGTAWLSKLAVGQQISIIGPLGNGFMLDDLPEKAILVGGGVGLPPMMYLAKTLREKNIPCELYAGAASEKLLPLKLSGPASAEGTPDFCCEYFDELDVKSVVCTDDGSCGFKGFVTQPFERNLLQCNNLPKKIAVYTCGPEIMMKTVAKICKSQNIKCQAAFERKMACGMGTCQSCVCKVHSDNEMGWKYKLVCTDGTVFDADDVIWE